MPKAPLLDDAVIDERLGSLHGWTRRENAIEKTLRFEGFREAVEFVSRLVPGADEQDHHPDVRIHWNELTLTLWTHASGGITDRDFRLAETIDALS